MSLDELADEVIHVSRYKTPVLVTPEHVSLRKPFFLEMADCLKRRCARPIRFDWLTTSHSIAAQIWKAPLERFAVSSIDQSLRRNDFGSIETTMLIASREAAPECFVVGISHAGDQLPTWTAPIRLT